MATRIFFLLNVISLHCFAQNETAFPKLQFKPFEKNDQLPYPSVFSIIEDNDGVLWFGTADGLARNDGYRLKSFFKNPKNKEGLTDNTLTGLINFNHKIYTSGNEGTSYYNYKFRKFEQLDTALQTNINKEFRVCFLNQGKRLLGFGVKDNYSIDENNKITNLPVTYNNEALKSKLSVVRQILSATQDGNNSIWSNSLFNILQVNPITLAVEQVITHKELGVQEINSVLAISNNLWICCNDNIFCYNTISKKKTTIKSSLVWHKKIIKYRYNNEDLLFAFGEKGYTIINPNSYAITDVVFKAVINAAYIDKLGTIWLGTDKGIFFSEANNMLIHSTTLNEELLKTTKNKKEAAINYFVSTKKHYYQILKTGDAAAQFDKNWKLLKTYKSNYTDTTRISMGGVNGIYEQDNYYWVTTWYKGLAKCTKDFKVVKWFSNQASNGSTKLIDTRSFSPMGNNNFFVHGYSTLAIFNIKEETYKKVFYNSTAASNILPAGLIPSAVVFGNICYFGTERIGFYQLNLITGIVKNVPLQYNNLQITKIIQEDSILWISTNNGLVKYNIQTQKSTTFLRENGLSRDKIYKMVLSKNNNTLWMCSYGGVMAFNTKTYKVNNYTTKDGLTDVLQAVCIDDSGNAIISNGIYLSTFNPKILDASTQQKKTVITELLVNNENIDWLYDDSTKYIKLSYQKNNIAFHFTIANTNTNEEYYYKLNNKWYSSSTGFIQFNNLAPGTYKIYVANKAQDAKINDFITIIINLPFYNTWWFYILCVFSIGGILYTFFKVRTANIRKQTLLQKTYEQKLVESEMQTLRSQMNPHFLFNTLNSINSYIIQNKTTIASEYLTTFSKLMRNILELSKQEKVSIEKEINALKMYMELEALRLDNKFDYSIVINKKIDQYNTYIPSLIIQPFVENAIWHGLHNKPEAGHIDIQVNEQNEQLIITIEDDGIGRKAATILKKQMITHKSFGIDITINRIKILNPNNTVSILDLYNNDNIANGTKVIITINNKAND